VRDGAQPDPAAATGPEVPVRAGPVPSEALVTRPAVLSRGRGSPDRVVRRSLYPQVG